ncbi:cation diffusion facilitator family transporter [bacterium]|nr:cation diffusion facilitator family transporter [bacterium]
MNIAESAVKQRQDKKERRQFWLYMEGWLSIVINVILFIAKYWVGLATGSVAILADAWHTLSDSLTSVVVLVGAKVSAKSPDEEHPFGHGRAELIASIIIGVLLAIVAFNFLIESATKLYHRESATFNNLAVVIFLISVVVKEGIAQFSIRLGKKYDSKSMIADGWHHRSDAIASALIVAGIYAGKYYWWIDGVLGIIVALLIFYATFDILKQSINPLIGEKPDQKLLHDIHEITKKILENKYDIHHVHVHKYGPNTEMTFHMRFQYPISFETAHERVTQLEKALRDELDIVATIHFEPPNNQGNGSAESLSNK